MKFQTKLIWEKPRSATALRKMGPSGRLAPVTVTLDSATGVIDVVVGLEAAASNCRGEVGSRQFEFQVNEDVDALCLWNELRDLKGYFRLRGLLELVRCMAETETQGMAWWGAPVSAPQARLQVASAAEFAAFYAMLLPNVDHTAEQGMQLRPGRAATVPPCREASATSASRSRPS